MGCKACEEKLLEYLYGELKGADAAKMEEHLAASEPCREVYRNFKATVELLAQQDEEPLPEQMCTRIMAHAEELADRARARPRRWAWLFRPALVTAMVAVIAAGVYRYSLRTKGAFETKSPHAVSEFPAQAFREAPSAPGEGDKPMEHREPAKEKEKEEKPAVVRSMQQQTSALQTTAMDEVLPQEAAGRGGSVLSEPPRPTGEAKLARKGDAELAARPPAVSLPVPAGVAEPAFQAEAEVAPRAAAPFPAALRKALELAGAGRCRDALPLMEDFAERFPSDEACGQAWIELGRCFQREGQADRAGEMARKALAFPAQAEEADALLRSLKPDSQALP